MYDYPIKKISPFINTQFPEYIRQGLLTDDSLFLSFMQAYYEWMEQSGNVVDQIYSLPKNRDLDTTSENFLQHFTNTFIASLPSNVMANKVLFLKYIKDFYRSKGTPKSYKFLFRILFNEDVEFYFPKNDLLRPSDGKWQIDTVIRTTTHNDSFKYINHKIVGESSNASAIVENVFQFSIAGNLITEIYLSDVSGEFSVGEQVDIIFDGVTYAETVYGIITDVTVKDPGTAYKVNDVINVSSDTGQGAIVLVSEVYGEEVGTAQIATNSNSNSVPSITLQNKSATVGFDGTNLLLENTGEGYLKNPNVTVSGILNPVIGQGLIDTFGRVTDISQENINSAQNLLQNGNFSLGGSSNIFSNWSQETNSNQFNFQAATGFNGPKSAQISTIYGSSILAGQIIAAEYVSDNIPITSGNIIFVSGSWKIAETLIPGQVESTLTLTIRTFFNDGSFQDTPFQGGTTTWSNFGYSFSIPSVADKFAIGIQIRCGLQITNTGSSKFTLLQSSVDAFFDSVSVLGNSNGLVNGSFSTFSSATNSLFQNWSLEYDNNNDQNSWYLSQEVGYRSPYCAAFQLQTGFHIASGQTTKIILKNITTNATAGNTFFITGNWNTLTNLSVLTPRKTIIFKTTYSDNTVDIFENDDFTINIWSDLLTSYIVPESTNGAIVSSVEVQLIGEITNNSSSPYTIQGNEVSVCFDSVKIVSSDNLIPNGSFSTTGSGSVFSNWSEIGNTSFFKFQSQAPSTNGKGSYFGNYASITPMAQTTFYANTSNSAYYASQPFTVNADELICVHGLWKLIVNSTSLEGTITISFLIENTDGTSTEYPYSVSPLPWHDFRYAFRVPFVPGKVVQTCSILLKLNVTNLGQNMVFTGSEFEAGFDEIYVACNSNRAANPKFNAFTNGQFDLWSQSGDGIFNLGIAQGMSFDGNSFALIRPEIGQPLTAQQDYTFALMGNPITNTGEPIWVFSTRSMGTWDTTQISNVAQTFGFRFNFSDSTSSTSVIPVNPENWAASVLRVDLPTNKTVVSINPFYQINFTALKTTTITDNSAFAFGFTDTKVYPTSIPQWDYDLNYIDQENNIFLEWGDDTYDLYRIPSNNSISGSLAAYLNPIPGTVILPGHSRSSSYTQSIQSAKAGDSYTISGEWFTFTSAALNNTIVPNTIVNIITTFTDGSSIAQPFRSNNINFSWSQFSFDFKIPSAPSGVQINYVRVVLTGHIDNNGTDQYIVRAGDFQFGFSNLSLSKQANNTQQLLIDGQFSQGFANWNANYTSPFFPYSSSENGNNTINFGILPGTKINPGDDLVAQFSQSIANIIQGETLSFNWRFNLGTNVTIPSWLNLSSVITLRHFYRDGSTSDEVFNHVTAPTNWGAPGTYSFASYVVPTVTNNSYLYSTLILKVEIKNTDTLEIFTLSPGNFLNWGFSSFSLISSATVYQPIIFVDNPKPENYYANMDISIISGTGAGQTNTIVTYNASTNEAVVANHWNIIPDATSTYSINLGYIRKAQVKDFGVNYVSSPFMDATSGGNGDAVVEAVLGSIGKYAGRWTTTDSFLDSNKVLQDDYYWQDYSYVLKSTIPTNSYENVVKNLVHPAGTLLFGELDIVSNYLLGPQRRNFEADKFLFAPFKHFQKNMQTNTLEPNAINSPLYDNNGSNAGYWNKANTQIGSIAKWPVVQDRYTKINLVADTYIDFVTQQFFSLYTGGLIAQYDFLLGSDPQTVYDVKQSSGSPNDGYLGVSASPDIYDPSYTSKGLTFDGNRKANLPSIPSIPEDLTFQVFVLFNKVDNMPIFGGVNSFFSNAFCLIANSDGSLSLVVQIQQTGLSQLYYINTPFNSYEAGKWYGLTIQISSTTQSASIYINDALAGTKLLPLPVNLGQGFGVVLGDTGNEATTSERTGLYAKSLPGFSTLGAPIQIPNRLAIKPAQSALSSIYALGGKSLYGKSLLGGPLQSGIYFNGQMAYGLVHTNALSQNEIFSNFYYVQNILQGRGIEFS